MFHPVYVKRPRRVNVTDHLSATCPAELVAALGEVLPETALVIVDADGVVRAWSAGAERLTGATAEERVGLPLPAGMTDPTLRAGLEPALRAPWRRVRRADGGWLTVRGAARPILADGVVRGAVIAFSEAEDAKRTEPADAVWFHGLLSRDPSMLRALQIVRNVAETDATVLVRGESGTGKELVARAIHEESARAGGPFVAVNCAAFSPGLLESELFGHRRGAFTGAVSDHDGIFAQADKGTLFLDEVAELPAELQSRLLRVLQERTFVPVGGTKAVHVDVRIVAATHRALREEVKAGRFREDLMYRLRVVPVFLPALRERRLDIELLLWHFIDEHNRKGPRRVRSVAPAAMRALLDHDWPGNVRELFNVVEHAFAVGRDAELGLDDFPPELREERAGVTVALPAEEEEALIRKVFADVQGDVNEAAKRLGMSRTTFWRKRRKYGLGED